MHTMIHHFYIFSASSATYSLVAMPLLTDCSPTYEKDNSAFKKGNLEVIIVS